MSFTVLEPSSINSTANFTFANLTVAGAIAFTGTNNTSNLGNAAVANYFIGNGALLTGITTGTTYANSNVADYLPTYTGNVSANYFIGNGSTLTNITGANISGNVTYAITSNWANIANSISGANVTGQVANALITGTVYTNAQPNITSVGTLANLDVTGNVSANYFIGNGSQLTGLPAGYANSNVDAYLPTYTGNVSANYFIGNGSRLTSLTGANVTGYVSLATTANSATTADTVTTNAQPNITSVGTLSGLSITGNLNITGNIIATGNLNYSNVIDLVVGDPLIFLGANNTANLYDLGIVASYTTGAAYHTGLARDATDGTYKLYDQVITEPTTVIDFANGIYAPLQTGNIISTNANLGNLVIANYFRGNGSLLTSTAGANVTGYVPLATTANIAGTVTTNAQPNITSVGTLANLSVTGNISAGNLTGTTYVAGTLTTAAQPNITSVGTLTSATITTATITTGNITTGNFGNSVFIKFQEKVVAGGSVTGTITPDAAAGTIYNYTLTGSITLNTLSNAVAGTSMTLILTQGGSGSYTLTSTMKFASGSKTLSTTVGAIDIISVFYDGSTYYASLSKGYV